MSARSILATLPCLFVMLTGCGAGARSAIRGQAAEDMSCPAESVTVAPAASSVSGPTDSGVYYAEGCDRLFRYTVGCNAFGYCPDPRAVDARDLLGKQAAFDLKCHDAALTITRLNVDTFGVSGCDRQASYVLDCSSGVACRVVQNTQAQ